MASGGQGVSRKDRVRLRKDQDSDERMYETGNGKIRVGDIVWGKIGGYPYWPGTFSGLDQEKLAKVSFFAAKTCGFLKLTTVRPYRTHKPEARDFKGHRGLKEAIKQAEEYMRTKEPVTQEGEDDAEGSVDIRTMTETLREKNIQPSQLKIGFLGLGLMGFGIVKNLVNSGHKVMVWNPALDTCQVFVEAGAEQGKTPSEVVQSSNVTFSYLEDPHAAKEIVFGVDGVLKDVTAGKGYIEMTWMKPDMSREIGAGITAKKGRYLEAQVLGSKEQAMEGTLVVIAAGDYSLFKHCETCFQAMGIDSLYVGKVLGTVSMIYLFLQLYGAVMLTATVECMSMAVQMGLKEEDVLGIIKLTSLACPAALENMGAVIDGSFVSTQLDRMLTDLKIAISIGDQTSQPMTTTIRAYEAIKQAMQNGRMKYKPSPVKKRRSTSAGHSLAIRYQLGNGSGDGAALIIHHNQPHIFLNLPTLPNVIAEPELVQLDVKTITERLRELKLQPSGLRIGFLGLGLMGSGMAKNLLNSGHKVMVWNRTHGKCQVFVKAGAKRGRTPSEVVQSSDVTFSCLANPQAAKEVVFGPGGVLHGMAEGKGYIEMTGMDPNTSCEIEDAIIAKQGRYLEAQIQGSKSQAVEGTLVIIAAGDQSLYNDCQTCFQAMGDNSLYLGAEVGTATNMYLVLRQYAAIIQAGLAEGMVLADEAGVTQDLLLKALGVTSMASPSALESMQLVIEGLSGPSQYMLQHMQKDLKLAITMGDQTNVPTPMSFGAYELFKRAIKAGYFKYDASALYIAARF